MSILFPFPGPVPSMRGDGVILLGVGALSAIVLASFWGLLYVARADKVIPPVAPETRYITQETEDSLSPGTLDKLLQHPNGSIRDVAINIVCDRALNDRDARRMLLQGITSSNYEARIKCHKALEYLVGRHKDSLIRLHHPETYNALVRSLELGMRDRPIPTLDNDHWDEFALRDASECMPLRLIELLVIKFGVKKLLDAGFVPRYLVLQPWGSKSSDRRRNFRFYTNTKSNTLSKIIIRLLETTLGYGALQRAELMPSYISADPAHNFPRVDTSDCGDDDGSTVDESDDVFTSGDDDEGHGDGDGEGNHEDAENVVPRTRWQTDEEQRLRRQHREAMVLNDGTRPLRRGDIIEPEHAA